MTELLLKGNDCVPKHDPFNVLQLFVYFIANIFWKLNIYIYTLNGTLVSFEILV